MGVCTIFRIYNPGQGQLPLHLDDLVPQDDLARVVHEVVERLDITEIIKAVKARKKKSLYRGGDAYHPRLLLKILFYGYCTGTFSSRKLAVQTRTLIPMMWVAGTEHPDFRTISDFRKEHRGAIANLFSQFLQLGKALGMVKMGHVAVDGSKLKANASKHKAMSAERLEKKIPEYKEQVEQLLQRADAADETEDKEHGNQEGSALPNELKDKQARLARMEQALAELQERVDQETGKTGSPIPEKKQINFTDSESRIMSTRQGETIQGYNGQIAVDEDSGLIVGATLCNNADDKNQLVPTLDAVEAQTGAKPEKASADNGYFTGDNIAELEKREIDGYIAPGREGKGETDKPYDKSKFQYDPDQDAYRCPQGHELPLKTVRKTPDGHTEWVYTNAEACKNCPVRHLCTKATKGGRTITRDDQEPLRQRMRDKVRSAEGAEIYKKRKSIVEPVWGQIKRVMGYRQVSLRGLAAVRDEFLMVCGSYNLRKITGKLRNSPELWSVMRNWTPNRGTSEAAEV